MVIAGTLMDRTSAASYHAATAAVVQSKNCSSVLSATPAVRFLDNQESVSQQPHEAPLCMPLSLAQGRKGHGICPAPSHSNRPSQETGLLPPQPAGATAEALPHGSQVH